MTTDQEHASPSAPVVVSDVVVEYVDDVDTPVYAQGAFVLSSSTGDITLVFYTEDPGHQREVRLEVKPENPAATSVSVHDPGPFVNDSGTVRMKRTFNSKVVFNRTVAQRVIELLQGVTQGAPQ